MQRWSYGINAYHKKAVVILMDKPWYICLLDAIFDFMCWILHSHTFCFYVHSKIERFCCRRTIHYTIPVDYDDLKEALYPRDKEFWDRHEEEFKQPEKGGE